MCAHVTQGGNDWLTLRGAAPLQQRPWLTLAADRHQPDQLPTYRVVVEAYNTSEYCYLGFMPSHYVRADAVTAATPMPGFGIWDYGGWYIDVSPSLAIDVDDPKYTGWIVLQPSGGAAAAANATSAYATTSQIPPVPAGSAVEFAVDYAAGTCRVAFYTPAAVAGRFVEAPYAKMELRFVATAADEYEKIPARSVPTLADSGVELYPAATASQAGVIWHILP
jgi:hypothetical protein